MVTKSDSKKKEGAKKGTKIIDDLSTHHDEAIVNVPDTPEKCLIWRDGDVRRRIRIAVAEWAGVPVNQLLSTNTLGELAKGTPWNAGQQVRLVNLTNKNNVFSPFDSKMAAPNQLLPASTTVAQWQKVVWRQQNPHTFCFVFGG